MLRSFCFLVSTSRAQLTFITLKPIFILRFKLCLSAFEFSKVRLDNNGSIWEKSNNYPSLATIKLHNCKQIMLLCWISASLSGTDSNYHYLPPSRLFILIFAFKMLGKPIMADKRAIKKTAWCGVLHWESWVHCHSEWDNLATITELLGGWNMVM